jgi:RNA polymerase sigma-70 factor (ECF subfamily)
LEQSDKNLVAAHLRGDATAFGEIVHRYGDGVLGYLIRMTGNRDQAEDLFQETFKKVHEKADTFRGGSFKSWLFTIATRLTIDNARRRRRRGTVSLDRQNDGEEDAASRIACEGPDPADAMLREEQRSQVRRAIASLPMKQRATLVMAYYHQLSYPEVAETLGCSVGTVKTQMSRALASLAKRLPDSVSVTK